MFPVQNGLICWLDAMDGKAGDTLLKDRTSYGHNLIVENFQQGYGFTGTSIKVKQSKSGTSNNNALYIANGGFKTSCKSFCICIERHNTNQPWYIFDGRGLNGQGLSTNHCFNGNTGSSYDNSKTRRDGVLTYNNSNLDTNKKTFLYFELKEAELFTLSILMRFSKNENTEGEFYSLYAYNRALTEEEILQNMEYENNKISYVNENNLPKIVDKLSNASNIKITGNKYGNRVQTVVDKIVEKADDVTKAIKQEVINNSYSFKVGAGNVDVSSDVEDGFGEVGIKGVTYQNIFNTFSFSSEASKYITANGSTIKWTKSAVTTFNVNIKYHNSLAQLGKTYTLVFYIYKNTLQKEGVGDSYNVAKFNIVSYNSGVCFIPVNKTGLVKVKLIQPTTTPSDGKPYLEVYKDMVGELEISYPILLEGDYTNDDKIPSQFEGIVGVGDKSKNLFNPQKVADDLGLDVVSEGLVVNKPIGNRLYIDSITPKPNTVYHISIQEYLPITTNGTWSPIIGLEYTDGTSHESYTYTGLTFLTSSAKSVHRFYIRNPWPNVIGCWKNVHIVESKIATPYEPYYDGHKIEILSNGKNLYKPNLHIKSSNGLTFSLHGNTLIVNGTCTKIVDFRPINITESIALELYNYVNKLPAGTTLSLTNNLGLKNYFSLKRNGVQTYPANTFIIQEGDYDISCFVRFEEGQSYNNAELKIQLEINNVATEFEPYIEDKTQILLDEPLMRLPNGVYDEITRDGKLIRRVGKVVFDGSESWTLWYESSKTIGFIYKHNSIMNKSWYSPQIPLICDRFISKNGHSFNEDDSKAITQWNANNSIFIRINKNSLETLDVNGFKQWLQANPTTVYYELAEPVITELPAPYLRMFKDGHLTFNTLVAPESNHVVQLNKSAQIQNAIKESQSLDNRISVLENNYDNLMLSTISRLNDLELDYTLK